MGEPIATVGDLAGICVDVDGGWEKVSAADDVHVPVDIESSVLPTGGATAANQAIIIAAMVNRAATVTIYNKTMTGADTEYSQALPANTKKFMIQCRGSYDILLAFTAEASGTTYITVKSGQNYWDDLVQPSSITLYFQCGTAAQVAEIVAWS